MGWLIVVFLALIVAGLSAAAIYGLSGLWIDRGDKRDCRKRGGLVEKVGKDEWRCNTSPTPEKSP